jgi:hypothetical protein
MRDEFMQAVLFFAAVAGFDGVNEPADLSAKQIQLGGQITEEYFIT